MPTNRSTAAEPLPATHTEAAALEEHTRPPGEIDRVMEEFVTADIQAAENRILTIYDELFRLTYAAAPDIRIARQRLSQKDEERYTAWAERFIPAIDGTVALVAEDYDNGSSGRTTDTSVDAWSDEDTYGDWSLNLDLPLYRRPLSVRLNVVEAEQMLAENELRLLTQELDIRLRELLAAYLESGYRALNIRNSVRLSSEHVDRIHRGYELRDQTRLELLRAQANLKELEARRDLEEQSFSASLRLLYDFTGLPPEHPVFSKLLHLLDDEAGIAGCINSLAAVENGYQAIMPYVEQADDRELWLQFEKDSLLHRRIELERNLAEQEAGAFTQNEYPDLSVKGYYGREDDTQLSSFDNEARLSLEFSVPLFSGGTLFSNRKTEKTVRRIADISRTRDLQQTMHDIENTRDFIINLRKVFATQQINIQQQQEIVTLSIKSYSIRQTTMEDLLTSKNRLIDAKNALMNTTGRLGLLYRKLAWQLGVPLAAPALSNGPPDA